MAPGSTNETNGHTNGFQDRPNGTNGHYAASDSSGSYSIKNGELHTNGHAEAASNGIGNEFSNGSKSAPTDPTQVPIAICGMGMRLPGGIHDDKALYDFLINKGDARSEVAGHRYNVDAYYSPHGKHGTISTKHGYFIDDVDFSNFDLSMFTLTSAEAEQVDPNHRLALEVVREAFESAGETAWRGKKIGTFVGMFSEDWQDLQHKDTHEYNPYRVLGGLDFALPNRIAYEYDLRGPSTIIKTACSSAGMGLHMALQAIRQNEISAAIVCGTNLILAPGMTISMSLQMALSPEGSSKSFDASADGYARGEGVTALYIKRLDDAIRDGNPIRAVIRSSASNADGKTNGLAMPNPLAHEAVIREAYANAGLNMSETAMVEAHGTGTKIGDPIEASAIANAFDNNRMYLGAIKPNLGHSEGAAAITSIIKAVLSLENRTIIPNVKFNTPNPKISWNECGLSVPVEPTSWPEDRAERISVNSYGIGGSNCHFVIDSAASFGLGRSAARPVQSVQQKPRKTILLFSANHPETLKKVAANTEHYLKQHPDQLADLAYTLAERREHLKLRSFSIVNDGDEAPLSVAPQAKFQGPRKVAFVFTGQGAQWVKMGRELMFDYPSFLHDVRTMDNVLQGLPHPPSWSIEEVLGDSDDKALIGKAEYSQPICTALQVALVNLLRLWNIVPSAVVGHSSGEIAAAYASGVLTVKDAIVAAYYRGYVCKTSPKQGAMAAVGMGREDVQQYLAPGVRIACDNSGSSVTLSGDLDAVDNVIAAIKQEKPDMFARKLQVEMAYHSHHMQAVGDTYHDLIKEHLSPRAPAVPFFSSVKAKQLREASDFGPKYWQDNLENPVLFHSATRLLLSEAKECSAHLEVGPHAALSGPLRQIYGAASAQIFYASVLTRGNHDTDSFLNAVGQLYSNGVSIKYPFSENAKVLTDFPSYPWHHEKSYWAETRVMKNWRFRKHLPHDLLGLRLIEGSDVAPVWRNELRLVNLPWLKDHCVGNDIVFPAAGYIAMAGEAVRQLSNQVDYTVRNVELSKALILYGDRPTEIVTSLRPRRLTTTLDSDWFEFEIITYDGTTWNKHCSGLVRSGYNSTTPSERSPLLDREVSSSRWYTTKSRVGLNYGPRFTGLENIKSSVTQKIAAVDIVDRQDEIESPYPLHPSTLDIIFQSLTVATCQGIYRTFTSLFLPTFIEELSVRDATAKNNGIHVLTSATGKPGSIQGNAHGEAEGGAVFRLKGFRGTIMQDSGTEATSELKSLQLQWKPHFDFTHASELMTLKYDIRDQVKLLERLYVLCAIESANALIGHSSDQFHMNKYRDWLNQQVELFRSTDYPLIEDSAHLVQMDSTERRALIPELLEECKASGAWAPATAISRANDQVVNVFEGTNDYLDLLLQDGVLTGIYSWYNDLWDFTNFMQVLGHAHPQMRILEIGAGTGGLTAKFLDHLVSDFGERLYLKYTFTDVSSGFFVQAKERFKNHDGIEYKALDISKDPGEQAFTLGEYDLIIASNVLHATPWLDETLTNVRKLLRPKGQLFLQELCPTTRAMSFIMGQFSGWWLSEDDGRIGSPFISPEQWDARLRKAGFDGCDSVTLDSVQPYTYNANIIAKPISTPPATRKVTLLRGSNTPSLITEVEKLLVGQGVEVTHCEWGQEPPADHDLISFLDIDAKPLLQHISEEDLNRLLALVRSTDPHAAQILGMARTIRSELAMKFATLELAHTGPGAAAAVAGVMGKLQDAADEVAELDPDMEYVWTSDVLNVGRFHWSPVEDDLKKTARNPETKALDIGTPGLLQTLHWTDQPIGKPAPDEVNLKMSTVGLNFKDVMIAMGIISGNDTLKKGTSPLGLEGAGIVTAVGDQVSHINIGDRVMTIGCESVGLGSVIQRHGSLCVKIPEGLNDEEAATMPVVYVTVLMFLVEKWKLERGQSILIHSAAGGVGICAIYVAKWLGAEIYATVGSEDKVAFLKKEHGIPRDHIFNSRDASFYEGIMDATNGVGVDLVLNSLSREFLHDSWRCVSPYGAMVEIGKRDMVGRGQLALDPFEDNRTFLGGDVARLLVTHKPTISRLMQLTVDQYLASNFKPITPITTFEAEHVTEAFRYMQKGTHIGKIVVKFPSEDTLPLTPAVPKPEFRDDASYLLVGGLGGLGKAIAGWMAAHGAKHFIFLSRSAGKSDEDQAFLKELAGMGCTEQCFPCDVADPDAVRDAVNQAQQPIRGVMQMAMVLRDVGVMGMDIDAWNTATRPKIDGTWNLHNLLPSDMDFFVNFSSVGGTFGYYGQSNYASANTFLDAFVQYRQSLGLAASVMDIGPVDDVGYVSRTPATRETLLGTLETLLTEQNFLDNLQLAIARSSPAYAQSESGDKLAGYMNQAHIVQSCESKMPIMDPKNGSMWKRDPRMAIYRNIQKTSSLEKTETTDHLKQFLSSMMSDPNKLDQKAAADTIAKELALCVTNFLMKGDDEIDLSLSLAAAGVDSLVAIEVRNWWRQNLGIEVSVLELMNGGSIEALGDMAAKRLKDKFGAR